MVVGCLGTINFRVSSDYVETVEKLQYSRSARYAVHQRHGTSALTEFVGYDPAAVSIDVVLDRTLGISDVMKEAGRFEEYMVQGKALPLVLGHKTYGEYRWTIQSCRIVPTHYNGSGDVIAAKITLSLQEYLRR
jgi:phage protein U